VKLQALNLTVQDSSHFRIKNRRGLETSIDREVRKKLLGEQYKILTLKFEHGESKVKERAKACTRNTLIESQTTGPSCVTNQNLVV
jgi:hypothetical protein